MSAEDDSTRGRLIQVITTPSNIGVMAETFRKLAGKVALARC
jgi:hypothetical protein